MIGLRHFKWICCSLVLILVSPPGRADEACETFIGDALGELFAEFNHTREPDELELTALVQANVDTLSVARFTLGKYAARVTADDLHDYSQSLNAYFVEAIYDSIAGGQHLSVDILKSFDRTHRDCVVETVIHRNPLEDLSVIWRIVRVGEHHQVLDMAIKENGNTIWLAIELRAQVIDLYERSDGDLGMVIRKLGIG